MQEVIFPAPLVDSLIRIMFLLRVGVARLHPTVAECRPVRILVWRWLRRIERRLLSLIADFQAGTLPPVKPDQPGRSRPAKQNTDPEPGAEPPPKRLAISRRPGWFLDPGTDTGFATWELRTWLNQPEAAALVAQAPQAGRLLRGLLRALGMALPDYLKRPRSKRKPAPPKPPQGPPPGPPWSTRYPPPEGWLRPGEVWVAWRGLWVTEPEGKPPPVEYA